MSTEKRRSRMTRAPKGKRIELTSRDVAIFERLRDYRYLRSTYLYAFAGGASEKRFKERLGILFHEGYIDRPGEQWRFADCRHVPAVYELGDGGRRVLSSHGATEPQARTALTQGAQRQFFHTLMICGVLASIELEARQHPHLRFISWSEILARAPQQTRNSSHPLRISVPGAQTGGRMEKTSQIAHGLVPDALFGLEYLTGEKKSYRFFALEADRGTMPIVRSDRFQTSYQEKMRAYRDVISSRTFSPHWGIPNLLVLTVTTSDQRIAGMTKALNELTDSSAAFLFKSVRKEDAMDGSRTPAFDLLSEPWTRIGAASMSLVWAA